MVVADASGRVAVATRRAREGEPVTGPAALARDEALVIELKGA